MEDSNPLVLNDHNAWYYPSQGFDSDTESLSAGVAGGNWGKKSVKGSRWVRRGKIACWGPSIDEWEAEDRARQRIRCLLPAEHRSPSPLRLPHLRSPSPPLVAPYPPPVAQHLSFTSMVMDRSMIHTFRSGLLDELEHATNSLIEGEAVLKRALGRLWQAINEDSCTSREEEEVVPKREDGDSSVDEDESIFLVPGTHKVFLETYPESGPPVHDSSHFAAPDMQQETLEKAMATLRELQDDGREYVEKLEEIREGLGEARLHRSVVWETAREKAIKEMQDAAVKAAVG